MKVICPYCKQRAEFVDSRVVYGKSYGMIYLCRNCMAWTGVQRGTRKPLGRLANAELRLLKREAHNAFDTLWKVGRFKGRRNEAYKWLAQQLCIPVSSAHIGQFGNRECRRVIQLCREASHGK